MVAYLFRDFKKRLSSTKRPQISTGERVTVWLKDDCSIQQPIFILEDLEHKDQDRNFLTNISYMYTNYNYYFIVDIISKSNSTYELICNKDCLATYKDDISNYTCFIERSSTNYNSYIPDNKVSSASQYIANNTYSRALPHASGTGTIVMRVSTQDGLFDYALTSVEFDDIYGKFVKGQNDAKFSDYNFNDYIKSCRWFPFSKPADLPSNYMIVTDTRRYGPANYFPRLSIAWQGFVDFTNITKYYGDFRDYDPNFSTYDLFLPAVGLVNLNPLDISTNIRIEIAVDAPTGAITYFVFTSAENTTTFGEMIGVYRGQVGSDFQLGINSQTLISPFGIQGAANYGTNAVGLNGNIESKTIAGFQIVEAVNVIGDVYRHIDSPISKTSGQISNYAEVAHIHNIRLIQQVKKSGDLLTNNAGRPTCKNLRIGALSGYVKCIGANVPINGTMVDKSTINELLNTGFYYE